VESSGRNRILIKSVNILLTFCLSW